MSTAICRHIHLNGARCGSPSLRDKIYCFHHIRVAEHHRQLAKLPDPTPTILHPIPKDHLDRMQREPILAQYYSGSALANHRASLLSLDFPPLEDRESIQLALSMLITAMAQNRVQPKQATAILYGLQVASNNATSLKHPSRTSVVTETVQDETGQQLAPDEDPESEADYQQLLVTLDTPEPVRVYSDEDYYPAEDDDEDDEDDF